MPAAENPGLDTAEPAPGVEVPGVLVAAASWSWRLVVLALAGYLLPRLFLLVWPVAMPVIAALLLTALVYPVTRRLRWGWARPLAASTGLLAALAVLVGLGALVRSQAQGQLPAVLAQLSGSVRRLPEALAGWGVAQRVLEQPRHIALDWLALQRADLASAVGTAAGYVAQGLLLVALTLVTAYFFLQHGDGIWHRLLTLLPHRFRARTRAAGTAAWATLTSYVRGTSLIAVVHGLVIGSLAAALTVPLAAPLGVLVFLGGFVPIAGPLVMGALTVLVAFGTRGWLVALILLAVLVGLDQLEVNVLQPLVMGRAVRLHPLAVLLTLAVGTVLGGIIGAVVAVPLTAIAYRAVPLIASAGEPSHRRVRQEDGTSAAHEAARAGQP